MMNLTAHSRYSTDTVCDNLLIRLSWTKRINFSDHGRGLCDFIICLKGLYGRHTRKLLHCQSVAETAATPTDRIHCRARTTFFFSLSECMNPKIVTDRHNYSASREGVRCVAMWATARGKHWQLPEHTTKQHHPNSTCTGTLNPCADHMHTSLWLALRAVPPLLVGQTFPALALNLHCGYILWHTNRWTFSEHRRENFQSKMREDSFTYPASPPGTPQSDSEVSSDKVLSILFIDRVNNYAEWSLTDRKWVYQQREIVNLRVLFWFFFRLGWRFCSLMTDFWLEISMKSSNQYSGL